MYSVSMVELHAILQQVQLWVFATVAVIASAAWIRRKDASSAWAAATFLVIALVVLGARMLPRVPVTTFEIWALRFLVAVLVTFPYLLFRFTSTFRPFGRWAEVYAGGMALLAAAGIFVLEGLPVPGQVRSPQMKLYVLMVVIEWVSISLIVVKRLWTSGRRQPYIARRRMQTLASGTFLLAMAVVVSGSASPPAEPGRLQVFTVTLSTLSAPLFLLGLAPPRFVVAMWRRPEELELREAEKGLMQANSPQEVANIVLPHAARLFGGTAARLVGPEGEVIGSYHQPGTQHRPGFDSSVPVGEARLVVEASPYAPYFGPEEQEILGVLGTLTELALIRSRQAAELQAATNAMREFVAIASHDLRTPITVIKGMALSLRDRWEDIPPDTRQKQLEAVVRQASALSRLVDDLFMVSRIQSEAVESVPELLDVKSFVEQILADEGSEGFEVRVEDDVRVMADPSHLTRMLANYIRNAKAYGKPPFSVEAHKNGTLVKISVSDEGAGVPEEFRERLFEKFARADTAESRNSGGTGLGLSIVKGLAHAAGGDAWFEPRQPRGSRFVVSLPVERSAK